MSDRERSSTAETTPIGTPRGLSTTFSRRPDKEGLVAWHHKQAGFLDNYVDSTLLESDFEDPTFPLFGQSVGRADMIDRTTPIAIATTKHDSSSFAPNSNRASALQATSGNEGRLATAMDIDGGPVKFDSSQYYGGAQPISMDTSNRKQPRRESLAGSMVTGMSWGGTSVGSWIRDEYAHTKMVDGASTDISGSIIMQGTSPFTAYQSPSSHSSSYLPKLEANFMKDFICCNKKLGSLHDLLQHYEDEHTGSKPPSFQKQHSTGAPEQYAGKAAVAANTAAAIQGQGRAQNMPTSSETIEQYHASSQTASTPVPPRQPQQFAQGFPHAQSKSAEQYDDMADLEMEEDVFARSLNPMQNAQFQGQGSGRLTAQSHFGRPASHRVPPLDMSTVNAANAMQQQYERLRLSQPTTPVTAGRNSNIYQNNPTVSSVNTPTLTTYHPGNHQPLQQQQFPDSVAPVPESSDQSEENSLDHIGEYSMDLANEVLMRNNERHGPFGYEEGISNLDLFIDDPAKLLFAQNGGLNNLQQPTDTSAKQLGDAQYSENSDLAVTIRNEQRKAGVREPRPDKGVPKPFHCPVIGCEKAYKNQNGLKYHKTVSKVAIVCTVIVLTDISMVTIRKSCKQMQMGPTQLSIPRR